MGKNYISRLQYEIRFNHILNFTDIIRKTANPFLRFAKSFNFQNEGSVSEIFTLTFENNYHIDCRFDRFILLAEGVEANFDNENSAPITMFFDIFNKFCENTEFSTINNNLLLLDLININDLTHEELNKKFFDKYYHNNAANLLPEWNDIALTLDKNTESTEQSFMIGPFTERDLIKRDLFPFKSTLYNEIQNKNGYMMTYKYFRKENKINYSKFAESFNSGTKIFNIFIDDING